MAKKKKLNQEKIDFLKDLGKKYSTKLKKNATKYELLFIEQLNCLEYRYIFQHPIVYKDEKLIILDFYFPELNLAIELDGSQHYSKEGLKSDRLRTRRLKKMGIQVIRIINKQVELIEPHHIKMLISTMFNSS